MDKDTLARAKELEKDIQQIEFALSYYKRGPCNAPTHEWAKVIGNIYDDPKLLKRH